MFYDVLRMFFLSFFFIFTIFFTYFSILKFSCSEIEIPHMRSFPVAPICPGRNMRAYICATRGCTAGRRYFTS